MVKIAKKSAQHPSDSSFQMKVPELVNIDQPIPGDGKESPHRARPKPKSLCPTPIRQQRSRRQIQILVPPAQAAQDQSCTRPDPVRQQNL